MVKKLSICIPVYNRKHVFRKCLESVCRASLGFSNEVEIVISDNNSEDDLNSIVTETRNDYESLNIVYNRNETNIGPIRNVIEVVKHATGCYCWIIGSDDFIKYDGIKRVLDVINNHDDIDFISTNFDRININKINYIDTKIESSGTEYQNIEEEINETSETTDYMCMFDDLVDPKYNNVYLGAIMVGIFRKRLWNEFSTDNVYWDGFNSVASIYPHAYIHAHVFIGRKAYYIGTPTITVGEGTREWTTDSGLKLWQTSVPLIHFKILGDMAVLYRINGLPRKQYRKCKNDAAYRAGIIYLTLFIRFYITRKPIKDKIHYSFLRTSFFYFFTVGFHKGILKSILLRLKRKNIN